MACSPLGSCLVDSSGWIEYLADRTHADQFARYIEGREALLISAMRRATAVPIDETLALEGHLGRPQTRNPRPLPTV